MEGSVGEFEFFGELLHGRHGLAVADKMEGDVFSFFVLDDFGRLEDGVDAVEGDESAVEVDDGPFMG